MSDHIQAGTQTGNGPIFATDQDSGTLAHYPISKLAFGALNTFTLVSSSAGLPVSQQGTFTVDLGATDNAVLDAIAASLAGTLTVGSHAVTQSGTWTVELGATDNAVLDAIAASLAGTLTVGSHAVTNAGTFVVQENGAALTALQVMDDWDESDRAKVNPIVGQAGVTGGNGTVDAATQRVVLAADIGLPAGTNALGSVSISSVTPGTSSTNLGKNEGGTPGSQAVGVFSLAIRADTPDITSIAANGRYARLGVDGEGRLWSRSSVDMGAKSTLGNLTLLSHGDIGRQVSDLDGQALVKQNFPNADLVSERVSNTDGNSTAFSNFGATSNVRNFITAIHAFRTDAGTTPIYIDFRDGTSGSILWTLVLPPNGGANNPAYCGPALFKTSANTALAYDVSAATSTVYISISGYRAKG